MQRVLLALIIIALSAVWLLGQTPFPNLINVGLFIFISAAALWITEAIHLTATALVIPLLAILFNVFPVNTALNAFAHPIIFIFLGGFSLAAAMQHVGLDVRIANQILKFSGGNGFKAIALLFLVTAILSMWVSNTAVAALMLPLTMGLLNRLHINDHNTKIFVLLGMAYSASIGGMGTLVGSPPNAIVAAQLGLTFNQWLMLGLPLVALLLPILLFVLYIRLKPTGLNTQFTFESQSIKPSKHTTAVLAIFLITVTLWLFGQPVGKTLGVSKYFDAAVALFAIIALVATKQVPWQTIQAKTDWGVLILFGGGLCLSSVLKETETSAFIAQHLADGLSDLPFFVLLSAVILFVIFLTELTSNTATAALLVPLFISLAQTMNVDHAALALGIGFAASCAFMLPVATPPNAVVFGSGEVKQKDMMSAGFALNISAALLLPFLLWWLV